MHIQHAANPSPTLWRTCRALANVRRLKMIQYLLLQKGKVRVTDVSRGLRIPLPVASENLRILNARGLLQATRSGREVVYRVAAGPSLPSARLILEAVTQDLVSKRISLKTMFDALTGFTHPRRILLVQAVAQGFVRTGELRRATGIPRGSLARQLSKLVRRGYLEKHKECYHLASPTTTLARSLLQIALSSVK
jgi:Mn-dependent DtxR family transcriptional regulator